MNSIPVLVGLSLAVGVGLIVNAIASTILDFGRRIYGWMGRRRGRLDILGLRYSHQQRDGSTRDGVSDLAAVPWTNLYAAATLAGLLGFALIGPHVPTFRWAFLFAPAFVWGLNRYLVYQQRRFLPGQVRQMLIDVRVHMSLSGSLLLGLDSIARSTQETAVVYRALKRRMAGGSAKSGLDVLQQLAADVKSPHLLRVVQRIRSAQQSSGLLGIDQAISNSIEELNEEIATACEEQIQHLPLRITLLAMPFLLGPIVILLFYPLVDRILKTLAGTAIGGGF
jgi:hypothetical protein